MPFPTDPFEQFHYNMVRVHSTFKLCFSSILKHLNNPDIIAKDLDNFLGYCLAMVSTIILHHDNEEEMAFPFLNREMDFAPEKAAHEDIHRYLSSLEAFLREAKADHTKFDPSRLRQLLEQLKEPLYPHLDAEVDHIKPDELRKAGFGEAEFKDFNSRLEKSARAHGDPYIIVPFLRSHTPPEFKDVWPPMPWIHRKFIIPYVLGRRYSGSWKYSPHALS